MSNATASASTASSATRNYAIVTAAYWGFTLTDGALRMLVLLHFYRLGYSPFTLAFLFLLYEAAGVLANLVGGWLATHYGIARMLTVGLVTQIVGFVLLSLLDPGWTAAMAVAWVVVAQGICGVAKDLTKTASKSAIKLTQAQVQAEAKEQAQDGSQGQLFKWVAWFTGSKNAMKGIGFFLGGVLLETLGFRGALWAMAGLLALAKVWWQRRAPVQFSRSLQLCTTYWHFLFVVWLLLFALLTSSADTYNTLAALCGF